MLVLLPDNKDGLRTREKQLSVPVPHKCAAKMGVREVMLFLPKFTMAWGTVDLAGYRGALGMPVAYTRFRADFSGINGHEPPHGVSLFILAVFDQAFVDVNEEGTETRRVPHYGLA